ncbi:MAG: dynamin family protein [Streptosporangiaceae bacterium]
MARMPDGGGTLVSVLSALAALGTERDGERLAALRDRVDAARLRVLVVGEAKRGKSTLINALLGRAVLPAGVIPLTAVTTTVRYGDDPRAEVRFLDGHDEKHSLTALPDLVTERGNPGNRRYIAGVTVYVDAPVLTGGVELVDTPGTGSVFEWDTEAAHEALETMDAAVFVLTADPPVSASERDLLGRVAELSVMTFTVLNKADRLDEPGLDEAVVFTRQVLGDAGHAGQVYPISALAALSGGNTGFTAFEADFTTYLSSRRKADLRASAVAQARRIAGSLMDDVALTRRAAEMRAAELLGLDLAVPEPGGRLTEDRRFSHTTREDVGQTELLAGAVRRWLPGEFGRRTAREHLRREAPGLAGSQIGRARADLHYRLAEATRALVRVVERRYADGTDRMQAALRTATGLREASAAEAARKEEALAEREAALRHALGLLDRAVGAELGANGCT